MYNRKKIGFSIVEFIIVISIGAFIFLSSVTGWRTTKQKIEFKDAQANLINSLEIAKNRAATGFGTGDHGIYLETNKIISFEGSSYSGSGDEITLPNSMSLEPESTAIIFSRLNAETGADTTITLSNMSGDSFSVIITEEGFIMPE